MARCSDGFAAGDDLVVAAAHAVDDALAGLGGRSADLSCVFVSGADPVQAEAALLEATRRIGTGSVLGCTADGVIASLPSVDDHPAVSVWMASMPEARLRGFHLEVMRTTSTLAVVGMPPRRDDDHCVLLLADPWSFPAEGFVEGSGAALDALPLVGGLAGAPTSGHVRLTLDGRVVDRGAVGVCIGGEVSVRTTVAHASRPVGPPMTVTASEGEAVIELAGRPATERLARVIAELTDKDQALASCGVLMGVAFDEYADDHGVGDFAVQSILGSDALVGALMLGDHVPVGSTVRVHVVDPEESRTEFGAAVAAVASEVVPAGALVFSGAPRGGSMGDPFGDLEAVRRNMGTSGFAGLLTIGGIGPVAGDNRLLGFASSMLVVGQTVVEPVLAG